MRIDRIRVRDADMPSPGVRLEARVSFDSKAASETWWIEAPTALRNDLNRDGDPWLVAALPLAATRREAVEIAAPVDPKLVETVREIPRIWRSWGLDLPDVDLRVEPLAPASPSRGLCAAFLSGGVDSFFSALRLLETPGRLDELIFMHGFDRFLDRTRGLSHVARTVRDASEHLGVPLVEVRTNLRQTRWAEADWEMIAHGSLTAFVALALSPRYRRVHVAASVYAGQIVPWGSHPDTDPRYSNQRTDLVYFGSEADRFDKVRAIATNDMVLQHLRVCYRSPDGRNCGRCTKCLMTVLMLEALGAPWRTTCFPGVDLDLRRVRRLRLRQPWRRHQATVVQREAEASGRSALAEALASALRRSDAGRGGGAWLRRLCRRLSRAGPRRSDDRPAGSDA